MFNRIFRMLSTGGGGGGRGGNAATCLYYFREMVRVIWVLPQCFSHLCHVVVERNAVPLERGKSVL